MIVRDLFFNTPARLKFMKRDAAEGAAVYAAVQHAALSRPEESVRFIRDGKEEMMTPGDGKLRSALYAVLGREVALGFLPCKGSGEELLDMRDPTPFASVTQGRPFNNEIKLVHPHTKTTYPANRLSIAERLRFT